MFYIYVLDIEMWSIIWENWPNTIQTRIPKIMNKLNWQCLQWSAREPRQKKNFFLTWIIICDVSGFLE